MARGRPVGWIDWWFGVDELEPAFLGKPQSRCIDCDNLMDPLEASEFMNCPQCRKRTKKTIRVRSLSDKGTESCSRKSRPPRVIGGAPNEDQYGDESFP